MTDTKKPEYDMAEEVRSFNILMEEMRGHFQLLSEGLTGLGERMDRRFDEQDTKFNARFDDLETAVGLNGRDIHALQEDVGGLKQDVAGLHTKFDHLGKRVNQHDDDITILKSAVGIQG